MTVSDIGSIASAVVALAALIVAVVSLRKTNKFGETTDRLNRLLIERETAEGVASKKADLSAEHDQVLARMITGSRYSTGAKASPAMCG